MTLPITSKYIGVTTIGGHVARAIDFSHRTDVWVALGKRSPWALGTDPLNNHKPVDDQHPPLPNPLTTMGTLDDPNVAKKAILQLVTPDDNGGITAYAKRWRPVTEAEAKTIGARWVYVYASFDYNEAPVSEFDSYVISPCTAGQTVLPMYDVAGYMINDTVLAGLLADTTVITGVDTVNKTITLRDPLTTDIAAGTFIVDLDLGPSYTYRQVSVLSHTTVTIAPSSAGQQLLPFNYITDGLLEYVYHTTPVPRALNSRTEAKLILTF